MRIGSPTRSSRWLGSMGMDRKGNIAIGPLAKLRNQLLRRPAATIGFIFSSHGFTSPAVQLAHFALPQAILLWTGAEVERALDQRRVCEYAELKFRACVDRGLPDLDIAAL